MKFIVQDTFSIKKVLIFGGFGLCRFQHKVGMNSFPMRMNVISYGTNSFPWGMYSFRSKIPIVRVESCSFKNNDLYQYHHSTSTNSLQTLPNCPSNATNKHE